MTAKELAEVCLDLAKGLYARQRREYVHPVCLHVLTAEEHKVLFFEDFGDDQSKRAVRMVCVSSAAAGAEFLAFCSEGWMLVVPADKDPLEEKHKVMNDLSLHPERQEVLMIEVKGPQEQWTITSRINRTGEHALLEAGRSEAPTQGWYNRFLTDLPWKETPTT